MNKFNKLLLAFIVIATVFSSCRKDPRFHDPSEVHFTSAIQGLLQTRLTGNAFDVNDDIGVFMKGVGDDFVAASAVNRQYTFGDNSIFSAASEGERIYFPESGDVDFVAYYPYQSGLVDTYNINVATQSNLGAIDLLYAQANGVSGGVPQLTFSHELSKVDITVNAGVGVDDLVGLAVQFRDFETTATYGLADRSIGSRANVAPISGRLTVDGTSTHAEAILIPGSVAGNQIVFTLAGKTFEYTFPGGSVYNAGTRYTYIVTLNDAADLDEVELESVAITDWTTPPATNVNLDAVATPPSTGTEELLYEERFSLTNDDPGIDNNNLGATDTYGGYSAITEYGVSYTNSVPFDVSDIRWSNTGANRLNPHFHIPANNTTVTLVAEDIDAADATDLRLKFKAVRAASGGAIPQTTDLQIMFNGVDVTTLASILPAGNIANQSGQTYGEYEIIFPTSIIGTASSTLSIKAGNSPGRFIKIDDIELLGTR